MSNETNTNVTDTALPAPVAASDHVSVTGYMPSVLPVDSITFTIA